MSNRIPGPRPSAPALVTKGCNRLLIHSVDSSARFANTATTNVCVVGLSVLLPVALLPSSAFAGGTTPISDEGNVEDSDDWNNGDVDDGYGDKFDDNCSEEGGTDDVGWLIVLDTDAADVFDELDDDGDDDDDGVTVDAAGAGGGITGTEGVGGGATLGRRSNTKWNSAAPTTLSMTCSDEPACMCIPRNAYDVESNLMNAGGGGGAGKSNGGASPTTGGGGGIYRSKTSDGFCAAGMSFSLKLNVDGVLVKMGRIIELVDPDGGGGGRAERYDNAIGDWFTPVEAAM